ncbi:hypothetical protein KIN20_032373 [Parelaphostrongylus tenuis]|uniref:Uncharacterized protein n=1 Tax=Parelaphostrongylus tenuis TaxID=148309 RepID=A0AAD5R6U4_PARTN|nr:hypothetical protein KIN20_032373 [Parelaphostrongylus tenuis]
MSFNSTINPSEAHVLFITPTELRVMVQIRSPLGVWGFDPISTFLSGLVDKVEFTILPNHSCSRVKTHSVLGPTYKPSSITAKAKSAPHTSSGMSQSAT